MIPECTIYNYQGNSCTSSFISFEKKMHLSERVTQRRESKRVIFHLLFIPQMPTISSSDPGQSQESEIPSWCPSRVVGGLGPSSTHSECQDKYSQMAPEQDSYRGTHTHTHGTEGRATNCLLQLHCCRTC